VPLAKFMPHRGTHIKVLIIIAAFLALLGLYFDAKKTKYMFVYRHKLVT